MELYFQPDIEQGKYFLNAEESRHAIKVLRHKVGDIIKVTDGKGGLYEVVITLANQDSCEFQVKSKTVVQTDSYSIHIAIAPTKNQERIEWFAEKATELGVNKITLLQTRHTEKQKVKLDRIQKKVLSAVKQSGQCFLPEVSQSENFKDFVSSDTSSQKFIAFVDNNNPIHLNKVATPGKSYTVLIGPEGDFSKEELELALTNGFKKVSLGKNILRTETAGIVACHILQLVNIH